MRWWEAKQTECLRSAPCPKGIQCDQKYYFKLLMARQLIIASQTTHFLIPGHPTSVSRSFAIKRVTQLATCKCGWSGFEKDIKTPRWGYSARNWVEGKKLLPCFLSTAWPLDPNTFEAGKTKTCIIWQLGKLRPRVGNIKGDPNRAVSGPEVLTLFGASSISSLGPRWWHPS
jgi:hypothetical protein